MMKLGVPVLAFLSLALALSFFFGTDLEPAFAVARNGAMVVVALGLLVMSLSAPRRAQSEVTLTPQEPKKVAAAAVATQPEPSKEPVSVAPKVRVGESEVLGLLGLLQQKGRLVDFLMDDVSKYPDAQVGAAARVVHQGCSAVVREYFDIKPVHGGDEGTALTLDKNYDAHSYRLLGHVAGEPPFRGRVLHRGWLTTSVKLPEQIIPEHAAAANSRVISPAEVELA